MHCKAGPIKEGMHRLDGQESGEAPIVEISNLIVDILKIGFAVFGFLLLFMFYKATTAVKPAILNAANTPLPAQ